MDLVFGNAESGSDVFNSDKYQLARQHFANPTRYRSELDAAGLLQGPFCDRSAPGIKDKAQIDKDHVVNYFNAVGHGVFNPAQPGVRSAPGNINASEKPACAHPRRHRAFTLAPAPKTKRLL